MTIKVGDLTMIDEEHYTCVKIIENDNKERIAYLQRATQNQAGQFSRLTMPMKLVPYFQGGNLIIPERQEVD